LIHSFERKLGDAPMDGGFRPTRKGLGPSIVLVAEEQFDVPTLIRLGFWGVGAIVALTIAVLAGRSDLGEQRVEVALANISAKPGEPSRTLTTQLLARAGNVETQNRKLTESIQTLSADRDALANKVTSLEQSLGDVTGSISKLARAPTQASPPAPAQAAQSSPGQAGQPTVVATLKATPPANDDKPEKPDEPTDSTGSIATTTEFGIDVGGAATMVGLRTRWTILKASYGPVFEGLRPVVSLREKPKGGFDLRLVAGPIANAAGAAKLCAEFTGTKVGCRPTLFDGQRLAAH
jgi:hypothetical protein